MIEPVSEALTISVSPARRAMKAMISSAALPKEAFSRPPMPGPVWWVRCSVASPMRPARGRMARQAATKTHVGRGVGQPEVEADGHEAREGARRMFFPVIMPGSSGVRARRRGRRRPAVGAARPAARSRAPALGRAPPRRPRARRRGSARRAATGSRRGFTKAPLRDHAVVEVRSGGEAGHARRRRSARPGRRAGPARTSIRDRWP